jgi:hypothetical protein
LVGFADATNEILSHFLRKKRWALVFGKRLCMVKEILLMSPDCWFGDAEYSYDE